MKHLALILMVVACGSKSAPPPAEPAAKAPPPNDPRARCAAAVDKAGKTGREGAEPDETAAKAQAVMTESCVETQWSSAVLLCFENGGTQDELRSCPELMTREQQEDMVARLKAAGI